jgi:pimeloyl-ACP methyl ester carboxylesterase
MARALRRPESYVGNLREVVGATVCVALYPFGLIDAGLDAATGALSGHRHDRAHTDTPVLLLHGYGHNRSGWVFVQRHLRRAGFTRVFTMNYNPLARDVPKLAEELRNRVDAIRAATGAERVHLAGHSLGGILIRYYIHLLGGDQHVGTAITVSSPHAGTLAAHLAFGPTATQLRPDSALLAQLDDAARPSAVRWIAYYSNLDLLVQPAASAMLTHPALHATNILVKDLGHLSILLSPGLGRSIAQQLAAAEGLAGFGSPVTRLEPADQPPLTTSSSTSGRAASGASVGSTPIPG